MPDLGTTWKIRQTGDLLVNLDINDKFGLVSAAGIEPAAHGLKGRCSTD